MSLGLLAGSGELPFEFLKKAKEKGEDVIVFALENITESRISEVSQTIWVKPFKFGKFLKDVKKSGISRMAILGKIEHKNAVLLKGLDVKALSVLLSLKDRKPETIIMKLIDELKKIGVEVIDPTSYLSHLLHPEGVIEGKVSKEIKEEAEFGMRIAKEVASLDIGQTVVVKDKTIIAVEGIEGTNSCIERGAKLAGKGFIVCKAARKNQDMRIDVPTVGPETVELIGKLGGKALVIEANKTFILNMEETKNRAKRLKVALIALK
jgi:DUF1009 family protein